MVVVVGVGMVVGRIGKGFAVAVGEWDVVAAGLAVVEIGAERVVGLGFDVEVEVDRRTVGRELEVFDLMVLFGV